MTGLASNVTVSGNYAFVTTDASVDIINISDPALPTLAGSYPSIEAYDVAVSGTYAYVANGSSGLEVLDLSNPGAFPNPVTACNTPGSCSGVAISGNFAYVADGLGLQIIDIQNPTAPFLASAYDTPGNAAALTVRGSYAYVADDTSGLQIIKLAP